MKSLISCHFYYLISRTTLVVAIFVVLVLGCSFTSYSMMDDESMGFVALVSEYAQSSIIMVRIMFSFLIGFLYAYSFEPKSDQYGYLLLTSISRRTYMVSKLILLGLISCILISLICLLYLGVGLLFIPGFHLATSQVELFLITLFQGVIVGLYCVLFIQCIPHMMVIFIPFVLLLFSLSMNYEDGGLSRLLFWVFPNGKIPFSFPLVMLHLVLLIECLVVINLGVYEKKDL